MDAKPTLEFLPLNLRGYSLFEYLSELIDWIREQYHVENIEQLEDLYDVMGDHFDSDYILDFIGGTKYKETYVTEEQRKALAMLLSGIYEIKGTNKGIEYISRLMGWVTTIYQWYWVNEQYLAGNPLFPEEIDHCSIILEIEYPASGITVEDQDRFLVLMSHLLWTCVKLWEIRWIFALEDTYQFTPDDALAIDYGTNSLYEFHGLAGALILGHDGLPPEAYTTAGSPYARLGDGSVLGRVDRDVLNITVDTP